jgi:hypothetical protein
VPVWVRWIGLQRIGINQPRVGAVNGNTHAPREVSTALTSDAGYA